MFVKKIFQPLRLPPIISCRVTAFFSQFSGLSIASRLPLDFWYFQDFRFENFFVLIVRFPVDNIVLWFSTEEFGHAMCILYITAVNMNKQSYSWTFKIQTWWHNIWNKVAVSATFYVVHLWLQQRKKEWLKSVHVCQVRMYYGSGTVAITVHALAGSRRTLMQQRAADGRYGRHLESMTSHQKSDSVNWSVSTWGTIVLNFIPNFRFDLKRRSQQEQQQQQEQDE